MSTWLVAPWRVLALVGLAFCGIGSPPAHADLKILYSFSDDKGNGPSGRLLLAPNKRLYGTTLYGGKFGKGTVYELRPQERDRPWKLKVLHHFRGGAREGAYPQSGVTLGGDGALYGVTRRGGPSQPGAKDGVGVAFRLRPKPGSERWTYDVLHVFRGNLVNPTVDGAYPSGEVFLDKAGAVYGLTTNGGVAGVFVDGGTFYKLTPPQSEGGEWTETNLSSFGEAFAFAPTSPNGELVPSSGGALIGVAGASSGGVTGSVFQLEPPAAPGQPWNSSAIWDLYDQPSKHPVGSLIAGADGTLYGTAEGGSDDEGGAVFSLTRSGDAWVYSKLATFPDAPNGPGLSGVRFGKDGALYGSTTWLGKCPTTSLGCGTLFKLTRTSKGDWEKTRLHVFKNTDGAGPGPLIRGKGGALYGTTVTGGKGGTGTVFKLTPSKPKDGV